MHFLSNVLKGLEIQVEKESFRANIVLLRRSHKQYQFSCVLVNFIQAEIIDNFFFENLLTRRFRYKILHGKSG